MDNTEKLPDTWTVRKIAGGVGRDFIKEHHYSRGCHNGPMCWGLFDNDELIGVCAFATPNSENVRASIFGPEYKDHVTELHRLVVLDKTPTNTESWFIARALKGLLKYRPQIWAVITFADSTQEHLGIIYQATNAIYTGTTGRNSRFYRDSEGRLRHPRQNGVNITSAMAAERGWIPERRGEKHRYIYLLGDRALCRRNRKILRLESKPYPKAGEI